MKKAKLLALALLGTASIHGQGLITFQYFGGGAGETPIYIWTTPANDTYTVGLYLSSDLSAPLATTTIFQNTGLFQYDGPDIVIPGTPANASADLTLRVWLTSAGSYGASSIQAEERFTSAPLGGVNPTPPPPALTAPDLSGPGALGFDGLVYIPEPSSLTLAWAGLCLLAIKRRRK
jgi:hypothetical protein